MCCKPVCHRRQDWLPIDIATMVAASFSPVDDFVTDADLRVDSGMMATTN